MSEQRESALAGAREQYDGYRISGSGTKPNDRIEECLLDSSPAITAKAKTSSRTPRLQTPNRSTSAMAAAAKAARIPALTPMPHKSLRRSLAPTRSAPASELLRAPSGFRATPSRVGSKKPLVCRLWSAPPTARAVFFAEREPYTRALTSFGPSPRKESRQTLGLDRPGTPHSPGGRLLRHRRAQRANYFSQEVVGEDPPELDRELQRGMLLERFLGGLSGGNPGGVP